jgi:hypothetical protein
MLMLPTGKVNQFNIVIHVTLFNEGLYMRFSFSLSFFFSVYFCTFFYFKRRNIVLKLLTISCWGVLGKGLSFSLHIDKIIIYLFLSYLILLIELVNATRRVMAVE